MSSAPFYSADDFTSVLKALMPRGRVWPKEPDSALSKFLAGLTPAFARNTESANNLLADAFPATALEMLPEWEESLGLPDPCAGESPTLQDRRGQVVARFAGTGGQSVGYYSQYAANLGYQVSIQNYAPLRCGQSRVGSPLGSQDWLFAWTVSIPQTAITSFRTGLSAVGEPLQSWGSGVLQCELAALAPAHTILKFIMPAYLDSPSARLDSMILS